MILLYLLSQKNFKHTLLHTSINLIAEKVHTFYLSLLFEIKIVLSK